MSLKSEFIHFCHDLIHVYSPRAEADSPQGTKFGCQQKGLIALPICCKFQRNLFEVLIYTIFFHEISLKSYFIQFFFHDLIHVYSPRAGGHTASRGQSFYVNRNFFSLRSSIASFKSYTTINSEKSFVLSFSHTKAQGTNFDLVVK